MFRGGLDPGYYENPPALTYLLYAIFKVRFTAGFPFGGGGDLVRGFAADPEAAFLTARVAVALIGTLVVGLAYWAGAALLRAPRRARRRGADGGRVPAGLLLQARAQRRRRRSRP